jgi:hypothetical protein
MKHRAICIINKKLLAERGLLHPLQNGWHQLNQYLENRLRGFSETVFQFCSPARERPNDRMTERQSDRATKRLILGMQ